MPSLNPQSAAPVNNLNLAAHIRRRPIILQNRTIPRIEDPLQLSTAQLQFQKANKNMINRLRNGGVEVMPEPIDMTVQNKSNGRLYCRGRCK